MPQVLREPSAASPPVRAVRLVTPDCALEPRPDGALLIRARGELAAYPDKITERLIHWARAAPDRIFMAERAPTGAWRKISYAETLERVRRIGTALLARRLCAERPIAILSGNDIEHALLALAAA